MKQALHILIDNNPPPGLVVELEGFWRSQYPDWKISHENEIAKAGTLDKHWIVKLRDIDKNREWMILTKDKGSKDKKNCDKLPILCKRHDHAYMVLSHNLKRIDQIKAAIVIAWPRFPSVVDACKKLKHRTATHVKLGQVILKKQVVGYQLRVRGEPLDSFLNSPSPTSEAPTDSFRLRGD